MNTPAQFLRFTRAFTREPEFFWIQLSHIEVWRDLMGSNGPYYEIGLASGLVLAVNEDPAEQLRILQGWDPTQENVDR